MDVVVAVCIVVPDADAAAVWLAFAVESAAFVVGAVDVVAADSPLPPAVDVVAPPLPEPVFFFKFKMEFSYCDLHLLWKCLSYMYVCK